MPDSYVLLARLIRPQGRNGEVLAEILTDFPERFAERRRVLLRPAASPSTTAPEPQPIDVENHWLHKGRLVLKFAGIDSINQAETLRGMDVVVPAAERTPLHDGAVYIDDLIGCHIIDEAAGNADIGKIVDVQRESIIADLLVVNGPEHGELLIPFARAYLVRVDLAAKEVRMRLPQGLAAINAPLTAEERSRKAAADADEPH